MTDDKLRREQALLDILAERDRQVSAEGWSEDHDDEHGEGQMALAAGCYALHAAGLRQGHPEPVPPQLWPWDACWWKPKDRRRDMVRAGALIVAEIERLDRAAVKGGGA